MLLAEMTWGQWLLGFLIVSVCLFLMLVILLQRGRGVGLAGAFGGGGSGAFGAKTGDVFTWITVAFAGVFLLLTILGNFVFEPTGFAIAPPPAAQVPPGEPTTISFPLEEGVDPEGVKIEMITEDGQAIPVDAQIIDEDAGSQTPAGQPQGDAQPQAPPGQEAAKDAASGDAPPPSGESAQPPPRDKNPEDPGR